MSPLNKNVEVEPVGTGELRISDETLVPQEVVDVYRELNWSDDLIILTWEEFKS